MSEEEDAPELEYKPFYENGPTKVGLLLAETQLGATNKRSSSSVALEGMLSGETKDNLIFDSIKCLNLTYDHSTTINKSKKAFVKKKYVSFIYEI